MRIQHKMKKLSKLSYPRHMLFFDVESRLIRDGDIIIHKPYLFVGKYVDGKTGSYRWHISFTDTEFWNWCISKVHDKEVLYMFAHNVTYDLIASKGFKHLVDSGFKVVRFFENDMTFILKLSRGSQKIVILNSAQLLPGTVSSLGELLGIPKLSIDYDTSDISESIEYCKRDVEIISKAIESWIDFFRSRKLAGFAMTLAGQSMKCFKTSFMTTDIYVHDNEQATELELEGYYGGRSECFRVGYIGSNVYVLDVNSMYPSVMEDEYYPTRLVCVRDNMTVEGIKEILGKWLCVARVKIRTDKPYYPVRINKRLVFPVGEFVTTLCTPELKLALDSGHIEEVYRVAVYDKGVIFKDFVNYFYTERLKAKARGIRIEELIYKLILNSLYGKFAQRNDEFTEVGECDVGEVSSYKVYNCETGEGFTERSFCGRIYRCSKKSLSYDSFPAISAHVTSYARMKILGYILRAGFENVYYIDTDSLFVNKEGYEKLKDYIDGSKLGYLKLEKEYKDLIIHNVKDYEYSGGSKCKGIPSSAKKVGKDRWEYVEWPNFKTFMNEGSLDVYYNKVVVKELGRKYVKRWIVNDGATVPLEVSTESGDCTILDWRYTNGYEDYVLMNDDQRRWIYDEFGVVIGYNQLELRV